MHTGDDGIGLYGSGCGYILPHDTAVYAVYDMRWRFDEAVGCISIIEKDDTKTVFLYNHGIAARAVAFIAVSAYAGNAKRIEHR